MGATFNIFIRVGQKVNQLVCEQIYESEQVLRFKVSLKDMHFVGERTKSVVLEKNILKKPYKWKIKEYNKEIDLSRLIDNLEEIKVKIDFHLNPSGYK